jgi:hypothetical protein
VENLQERQKPENLKEGSVDVLMRKNVLDVEQIGLPSEKLKERSVSNDEKYTRGEEKKSSPITLLNSSKCSPCMRSLKL